MKTSLAFALLCLLSSSSCAVLRGRLANASAERIKQCTADELEVSDTSSGGLGGAPKWTAVCHGETYECSGFFQLSSSVSCRRQN